MATIGQSRQDATRGDYLIRTSNHKDGVKRLQSRADRKYICEGQKMVNTDKTAWADRVRENPEYALAAQILWMISKPWRETWNPEAWRTWRSSPSRRGRGKIGNGLSKATVQCGLLVVPEKSARLVSGQEGSNSYHTHISTFQRTPTLLQSSWQYLKSTSLFEFVFS